MIKYSKQILLPIFAACVLLQACTSKFDMQAIPLYDEVYVPVDDSDGLPRRQPAKNPLVMPKGYEKPSFNKAPTAENMMLDMGKNKEPPRLSAVPKKPRHIMSQEEMMNLQQQLSQEGERAGVIKEKVMAGEVPHEMIMEDTRPDELPARGKDSKMASLPWTGDEKHPESLRRSIEPITFADSEEGKEMLMEKQEEQEREIAGRPTHEFGSPEIVEGDGHSTITHTNKVGYQSLIEKELDEDQFRLKPFRHKEVPNINKPRIGKQAKQEDAEPPKFLPESRYRARRVKGPYYSDAYGGYKYLPNNY